MKREKTNKIFPSVARHQRRRGQKFVPRLQPGP
jgi:hypothetical protein